MYMAPLRNPLDPSKPINFIIFGSFCVEGAFGNMLTSIVPNSYFWKRLGARDMTVFGSHVGPDKIHQQLPTYIEDETL